MEATWRSPKSRGPQTQARTLVFLLVATVLMLAGAPAFSAVPCRPAFPQSGSNCSKDSQCCAGLVCQSSACRPGCRVGGAYYAPGAKNPANPCQSCQPDVSTTSFTTLADGASCSDGNACTQTDSCQGGVCRGTNPLTCIAQDACHAAGTCNPSTGLCSNPSKPSGTACDDGNACTRTDTCQTGVCRGANPLACTALDACHSAGICDPATGVCSNPVKANGTLCSDGNSCTRRDTCQAGVCTGSNPVTCPSSEQCHDPGVCDPATGACSSPNKPDGTPCSDGDACTTSDTCQSGTCTSAGSVICLSPGACHAAGSCNHATGQCVYPPQPDGTACSDGNACTNNDTCQGGTCTPGDPTLCFVVSPPPCRSLSADCNPANGQCVPRSLPNGTACDDGDACTLGDSCQGGACTGSSCGPGSLCCGASDSHSCKNIGSDSANCGACGHTCTNSVCLLGQCYDGCVIDGVGYQNGAHNPGNDCQECNTTFNRTAWSNRGDSTHFPFCSAGGCFSGICQAGACFVTSQGGGCPNTTCATSTCTNGHCAFTSVNEGAVCTPPVSTNPCKSSSTGTCHSGECQPANANDGGYCTVTTPPSDRWCHSSVDGACASGACAPSTMPNGTECHPDNLCIVGSCTNGDCPMSTWRVQTCSIPSACGEDGQCQSATGECVYPDHPPYPSGGQITCNLAGGFGPDPSKCCPGQECICAPTPNGIPQFCLEYDCWNPEDIPGPHLAPGAE